MVKINLKEYAWGDIQVIMFGRPIVGLKGIEYKTKKDKELNYGAGRNAYGIQHGRRANEGTLKICQSELQALNDAAKAQGYKDILDVDMDIVVSYIPEDSVAITIDRIICASFSEMPKGMSNGDMSSEHSMPFVCLDIEYGV